MKLLKNYPFVGKLIVGSSSSKIDRKSHIRELIKIHPLADHL